MRADVNVGDILVHSIGFGCDSFFQVVKKTEKTVTVCGIETKSINHKVKHQTFDYVPVKDKFDKSCNAETFTLKLKDNGDIGPCKRLMWWRVWDGKPKNQWSS